MASSGSMGTLSWSAKLDSNEFKKGVRKVKKEMKEAQKAVGESLKVMAKGFAVVTGAVTGATVALGAMVKESTEAVRELKILSKVADTTFQDFQKMAFGAKKFGVEQDKLSDILKDVKDRVGDFIATGGGPMVDFFENIAPKIGITADAFKDLSGKDSLQLFYNSLEKANLSQSEMVFYMEAMASDLTMLQPLLSNNGKLLGEMGDEAERLGLVLSDEKVNSMTSAWDSFDKAIDSTRGLTRQLSAELGESFGKTFTLVQTIIETFRDNFVTLFGDINSTYVKFINMVVKGIKNYGIPAWVAFQNIIGEIGRAVAKLFNLFLNSPLETTIDNWTIAVFDFGMTMRESLAFGLAKTFEVVFNFIGKGLVDLLTKLNNFYQKANKLFVKLGLKSEVQGLIDSIDSNLQLETLKKGFEGVSEEIGEVVGILNDELELTLSERIAQTDKLKDLFSFNLNKFSLSKLKEFGNGDGDGDGKTDPIKVEVDPTSQNNVIATAGSVEEFNLMKSQRKEELNILKKIADNTSKTAKNQTQDAGFNA